MLDNEEIIADMELSDLVPRIYERQNDDVITHSITNDDCASFVAPQTVSQEESTVFFV